eukprot:677068-Prymnesium_polylepis.1
MPSYASPPTFTLFKIINGSSMTYGQAANPPSESHPPPAPQVAAPGTELPRGGRVQGATQWQPRPWRPHTNSVLISPSQPARCPHSPSCQT